MKKRPNESETVGKRSRLPIPFAGLILISCCLAIPSLAFAQCVNPPPNLVSWWTGDGDASDLQGGQHGTLYNGATFAPGFVTSGNGQAFSFDGVDDYVEIAHDPSLAFDSAVSISLWFNANRVTGTAQTLAGRSPAVSEGWQLDYTANGGLIFWVATGFGNAESVQTTPPLAGDWHHVVGTWDGATIRLYLNGVEVGSTPQTGTMDTSTNSILTIGAANRPVIFHFDGLIDEVQLFDRGLTSAEVLAIYNAGSDGVCKGLDSDGDGLPDDVEILIGTDPNDADSDDDGVDDGTEVDIETDPLDADSDDDTINDGDEIANGTDPLNPDTDNDGVNDNVDPTPTEPGVPADFIEQMIQDFCDSIAAEPLSSFKAKNNNAAAGRQNALCNKIRAAGHMWNAGNIFGAADKLDGDVRDKISDWMNDPAKSDALLELDIILILTGLL